MGQVALEAYMLKLASRRMTVRLVPLNAKWLSPHGSSLMDILGELPAAFAFCLAPRCVFRWLVFLALLSRVVQAETQYAM